MNRAVFAVGALVLLAAFLWWATRPSPPAGVSGRGKPGRSFREKHASEAAAKLETLEEILRSKNDNDPRLDREFNALSPEAKRLFRRKYRRLPPESRNERGTIVYLLGRNLSADEDWAFLREVVGEPPCLSLADCSREMNAGGDDGGPAAEITLAYPQLVALKQAERALAAGAAGGAVREARRVIRAAKSSKAPAVARLAARLERR